MCKFLKKLFSKPEEPEIHPAKRALFFGINNYPGKDSDLRGCVNDVYNFKKKLESLFPDFIAQIFTDEQVTVSNFIYYLAKEVERLQGGDVLVVHYSGHGTYVKDHNNDEGDGFDEALYLYDGPLIDDDIGNILSSIPQGAHVVIILDCCFSGTITRATRSNRIKFLPIEDQTKIGKIKSKVGIKSNMNWITFSGSSAEQTSADAYIEGQYTGAFTYFLLRYLNPDITYTQWHNYAKEALAKSGFEQVPQLEGPFTSVNSFVFVN